MTTFDLFVCFGKLLPKKNYLQILFKHCLGYKLNLSKPKTFNEKMQWMKVNMNYEKNSKMVDKYEVKLYVTKIIGKEHVIKTIGMWNSFDEIDFTLLPKTFVLKCTHDSGGVFIIKDKMSINKELLKKQITKCMKKNYYWRAREGQYRHIKPRIIAEEYLSYINNPQLHQTAFDRELLFDYKLFVFSGKVLYIQVDIDRFTNHKRNFYDRNWVYIPFSTKYETSPERQIPKPECLPLLIQLAEKLSSEIGAIPFLRIDFYIINNNPIFGELTFFHGSGLERFTPELYDKELGEKINLHYIDKKYLKNN